MGASDTLTYDQDPPHRPGLSELGGGAKLNDTRNGKEPDPVTMARAEEYNQFSRQHEAANRVLPLARVWVSIIAGVPTIVRVQALGSNVNAASFTPTDEGAGQTLIAWKTGTGAPAGALPDVVGAKAWQTDDVEIDRVRQLLTTSGSDPALRVKTKLGATLTDANFAFELF